MKKTYTDPLTGKQRWIRQTAHHKKARKRWRNLKLRKRG